MAKIKMTKALPHFETDTTMQTKHQNATLDKKCFSVSIESVDL
jgi:hypothetical protein